MTETIYNNNLTHIEKRMASMEEKMNKMYTALVGDDISRNGGLVARIVELERVVEAQDVEIKLLKESKVKTETYQKIMWSALGSTGAMIMAYIVNLVFHK